MGSAETVRLEAGDIVAGKYRIEGNLGSGGMASVYEATHIAFGDRVAIKILHERIASNADHIARFLREGRSVRQLKSEHVAKVFDIGTLDSGVPFMVMELLRGVDLGQRLRDAGPLPIADAVDAVLQASDAIAEAHMLGIIHRDLKPANLFVASRRDGSTSIKVLDFGISKVLEGDDVELTQTATTLGSPPYMSPEQVRSSKDVDARTDIWSLGVILFQILGGRRPFPGRDLGSVHAQILLDPPLSLRELRPDIPPALEAVILRCIEKKREQRYSNVAALVDALAPFASADVATGSLRIRRMVGPGEAEAPRLPAEPLSSTPAPSQVAVAADPHGATTSVGVELRRDDRRRRRNTTMLLGVVGVAVLGVSAMLFRTGGDRSPGSTSAPASAQPKVVEATTSPAPASSATASVVPSQTTSSSVSAKPSAVAPPKAKPKPKEKPKGIDYEAL